MTVKLTRLFRVGAVRKSTRHLYTPASVAAALSTVRWPTGCRRSRSCESRRPSAAPAVAWKYARSPNAAGDDHHLGEVVGNLVAAVCCFLVSYLRTNTHRIRKNRIRHAKCMVARSRQKVFAPRQEIIKDNIELSNSKAKLAYAKRHCDASEIRFRGNYGDVEGPNFWGEE